MNEPLSMTGFGRAEITTERGRFIVEARSLNARFLEIGARMPSILAPLEMDLRARVKERLARGKVDLLVRWEPAAPLAPAPRVNLATLESLLRQVRQTRDRMDDVAELNLGDFLRLPGVVEDTAAWTGDSEAMEAIGADLMATLERALDALIAARAREGRALAAALFEHLRALEAGMEEIQRARGEVTQKFRERLRQRIEELLSGTNTPLDPGRLEVEVAIFADRADIAEELDRLAAHLGAFRAKLKSGPFPAGRALDFQTQELLREVNTIASKARDLEIAGQALAMKNVIESIREQVMNIE